MFTIRRVDHEAPLAETEREYFGRVVFLKTAVIVVLCHR